MDLRRGSESPPVLKTISPFYSRVVYATTVSNAAGKTFTKSALEDQHQRAAAAEEAPQPTRQLVGPQHPENYQNP